METPVDKVEEQGNSRFLPYLWGMETEEVGVEFLTFQSSYRTYEEWKPFSVSTMLLRLL